MEEEKIPMKEGEQYTLELGDIEGTVKHYRKLATENEKIAFVVRENPKTKRFDIMFKNSIVYQDIPEQLVAWKWANDLNGVITVHRNQTKGFVDEFERTTKKLLNERFSGRMVFGKAPADHGIMIDNTSNSMVVD